MSMPITSLIDAASEAEGVLFGFQRTNTALLLFHDLISNELPRAEDGEKLDALACVIFATQAESYIDTLFALLENLGFHIKELADITYETYEAAKNEKEEKTP